MNGLLLTLAFLATGVLPLAAGTPTYNPRHEIPVTGSTGIANSISHESTSPTINYDLNGNKIQTPAPGQIYLQSGKKFIGAGK